MQCNAMQMQRQMAASRRMSKEEECISGVPYPLTTKENKQTKIAIEHFKLENFWRKCTFTSNLRNVQLFKSEKCLAFLCNRKWFSKRDLKGRVYFWSPRSLNNQRKQTNKDYKKTNKQTNVWLFFAIGSDFSAFSLQSEVIFLSGMESEKIVLTIHRNIGDSFHQKVLSSSTMSN